MPQLNIADFPPQLVWLAITFVILYFLMAKVAIPGISEVLESRQNRISSDLEEARRLSEDADKAKADYEQALAEARAKAHGIVSELKASMAKEQEASKAELDAELAKKAKAAEASIREAKETALSHVREIAAETAKSAVTKLVAIDVSDKDVEAAVAGSMKGEA
ncbi:F0F1 ATP synthase subunit B' [Sneathiella chungangensis]|uniref:ATP synthase subunit b n=1 Tax=Sneathiella chungangensis TaxID=1418234 RepID=A0A845MJ70_9PROT|nr:F0F1 ATP synthase subunit B' [Sneathiella chungangensis]MZR23470.1 F0F1 ATP synthase subunit B' [Sneathiella chungangensis]